MICQLSPGIVLRASRKDPLSVAEGMPVLAVHPSPMFLRMSSSRPALQAREENCRAVGEGVFTHLGGVIATSAANDRVEMSDQSGLGSRAMGSHYLSQLLAVAFNLVLSGRCPLVLGIQIRRSGVALALRLKVLTRRRRSGGVRDLTPSIPAVLRP